MRLAILHTRSIEGVMAHRVNVEVHISAGLPKLAIVGLPETAVKESKDRVRSALLNSQFDFPLRHITVSLAPADLPKEGGQFDLPIAIGILIASGQLPSECCQCLEFAGELALSGQLRPLAQVLPIAIACQQAGTTLVCPNLLRPDNGMPQMSNLLLADSLRAVADHLLSIKQLSPPTSTACAPVKPAEVLDLQDIKGQPQGKRVLEIAAAGGHSLLLQGPPGTGKTLLASRLPSILPPLTSEQALEVASIYALEPGGYRLPFGQRPFRAPHHTLSAVAMVGGGSKPKPGEITLAHQGVLFLDELPEFPRKVLEVLREPLEAGKISISRAQRKILFPAEFQLIAAMNPCPCGYQGDQLRECRCSLSQIQRYQHKISGPLLDRMDLTITIPFVPPEDLLAAPTEAGEGSAVVKVRVQQAQTLQVQRQTALNAHLANKQVAQFCELSPAVNTLLTMAVDKLKLSARSVYRIIKVSRTIADLAGATSITTEHLQEALSYRPRSVAGSRGVG